MRIAYFDCSSGISGDMCLGSLVDAGAPLREIEKGLGKLGVKGYTLTEKKVLRAGIAATKVDVIITAKGKGQEAKGRKWKDIQQVIKASRLPEETRQRGYAIFRTLFEAEAKVHGSTISRTHLHELGCEDCLVDVFGTLIGLSILGIEKVYASPVNVGSGRTKTSHGMMPVPAPATAEIMKNIPCYSEGPAFEKTTPTGAAILKTLAAGFGPMPLFSVRAIGNGAGSADPSGWPNLLRVMTGESNELVRGETVTVIETNIDDMNPQIYEYVMERLFDAGALDVSLTPVMMKKSRPGMVLTVLCNSGRRSELIGIILKETTTIGVRYYEAARQVLERRMVKVSTKYGEVRVKQSAFDGDVIRVTPEYEDCKKMARISGDALSGVIEEATAAYRRRRSFSKKGGGR